MEKGKSLSDAEVAKGIKKPARTLIQNGVSALKVMVYICTVGLVFDNEMDMTDRGQRSAADNL